MNSATRLAALLKSWSIPVNTTPFKVRGDAGEDGGLTTWRSVAQASELLLQVERALDGLETSGNDTAVFRPYVASWYSAVFSGRVAFEASVPSAVPAIDPFPLQALQMLGVLLERLSGEFDIPQVEREEIARLLDDALEVVQTATELSEQETIALAGLIRAAQRVLGRLDFTGPGELRTRVSELSVTLASAALRMPEAETEGGGLRARLLKLSHSLASHVFASAGGAAIVELSNEGTKAITHAH